MPFLNPWFVSKLLLFLLSSGRKQGNRLKVVRSPNPHLYDHHRHHIITIFGAVGYTSGKFFIFQTHYYAFRGCFRPFHILTYLPDATGDKKVWRELRERVFLYGEIGF